MEDVSQSISFCFVCKGIAELRTHENCINVLTVTHWCNVVAFNGPHGTLPGFIIYTVTCYYKGNATYLHMT